VAASTERASAAADRAATAAETDAAAAVMEAANAESARAAVRAAEVALAQVEAIHSHIEDAHAKIFQASSESILHPTSEDVAEADAKMLADDDMAVATNEIAERELEMQEAAESDEVREDELCLAQEDVEKYLSVEESAVEYQRELWRRHYYEYYNLEGNAEDKDEDNATVEFSLGDAESTNGGMLSGQVVDISSYPGEA
jgi:hypothetical protein